MAWLDWLLLSNEEAWVAEDPDFDHFQVPG
jgi:hypothetical protein